MLLVRLSTYQTSPPLFQSIARNQFDLRLMVFTVFFFPTQHFRTYHTSPQKGRISSHSRIIRGYSFAYFLRCRPPCNDGGVCVNVPRAMMVVCQSTMHARTHTRTRVCPTGFGSSALRGRHPRVFRGRDRRHHPSRQRQDCHQVQGKRTATATVVTAYGVRTRRPAPEGWCLSLFQWHSLQNTTNDFSG